MLRGLAGLGCNTSSATIQSPALEQVTHMPEPQSLHLWCGDNYSHLHRQCTESKRACWSSAQHTGRTQYVVCQREAACAGKQTGPSGGLWQEREAEDPGPLTMV